jgi:hypothetical protein
MLLKAVEEPIFMRERSAGMIALIMMAFSGISKRRLTFDRNVLNGSPLSLANDHSCREAAAMFVIAQKVERVIIIAVIPVAAPFEPVAL